KRGWLVVSARLVGNFGARPASTGKSALHCWAEALFKVRWPRVAPIGAVAKRLAASFGRRVGG
ncbi:MAG: hypothetical protein ACRDGM_04100, partial [bacterium]